MASSRRTSRTQNAALHVVEGGAGRERRRDDGRPLVLLVIGGRSDLVTLAPVVGALERTGVFRRSVVRMADARDVLDASDLHALSMPEPDCDVTTGTVSDGMSTAVALATADSLLDRFQPAVVVVSGASGSAFACALAATRSNVPVARVEAGLRGHDWSVPEQVNRVMLDTLAQSLFASSETAAASLAAEGVDPGRIHHVGSTAVDSVRRVLGKARARAVWREHGLAPGGYVVIDAGRGTVLTEDERLARTVEAMAALAREVPVVFPMDPSISGRLEVMGDRYRLQAAGVRCLPTLPYVDFVSLVHGAGAVVTESGTLQEECSALGVRCYTLGSTTDRAVTTSHGTNMLLGDDPHEIAEIVPSAAHPTPSAIPLWDGRAGERIAATLVAGYALVRAV